MAPRKKEDIEVVFGFKQVLVAALAALTVVAGAFFWGFEAGHRRASRGAPSLLSFLEEAADPHAEPVQIPQILLSDLEEDAGTDESGAPAPVSEEEPESAEADRVKPSPAAQLDSPPPAAAASRDSAPAPAAGGQVHYQVAALRVRKNALELADRLRGEGFPAKIRPAEEDGLYRVYVGPFPSAAEAASARVRLDRDGYKPMAREF